ncbi:IclR family acetate operon transcriptional repressor [Phycicoccus badiiscoriae]|uniref:IclR family acetate operon transcriptional repressor n=1 Tax=Pedococcus badiiscoriae TaxID=642776 RepID=A0A852WI50_9MICO|nr:IclR family transcriptional regulator [Pedococcus badiiscoriae]NYG08648.1 IclR family acetate operon transcriptional repressor [Pedococcus badiiscoriae]
MSVNLEGPANGGSADRATAVAKVVRVVEALTEHSGVSEISRTTGLPTSTVHRIIQELVSLGWVRGDGDHGYLPGAGLLTLSVQASSDAALGIVTPILEQLRDATTHTVHFALRQGDQAVYVAKIEGRRAYEMRSRVGLGIQMHCTGIGKAVMAALPEEEVRGILQRSGMPPMTSRTITDPEAMLEHLRLIARRGYATDDEENELHTRCVAAVVRDHRGVATGGISMSAMAFEIDEDRVRQVAPLVVSAAREVSQALGYRPTPPPAGSHG